MFHHRLKTLALAAAFALGAGAVSAATLGAPSPNPSFDADYCCNPAGTNEDNFDGGFHYVELIDSGPGYVELRFVATSWPSWFEYRIDDVSPSSGTAHPTIAGEFIHPNVAVSAGNSTTRIFSGSFVDIRSAFGPERDWDFDWTRFNIPAVAPVPLPAGLPLLVAGLGLFGVLRVRRG